MYLPECIGQSSVGLRFTKKSGEIPVQDTVRHVYVPVEYDTYDALEAVNADRSWELPLLEKFGVADLAHD